MLFLPDCKVGNKNPVITVSLSLLDLEPSLSNTVSNQSGLRTPLAESATAVISDQGGTNDQKFDVCNLFEMSKN